MLTTIREEEVIHLCQKLIQAKSYSGEEDVVANHLKAFMEEKGFDEVIVDHYGNVIGKMKGKRPGLKVLFDGHMDTVPVGNIEDWTFPPFEGQIHNKKIYGRGTSDMKGALAAMVCAVSNFAKDCDKDFSGEIYVAGVVHEECFEGVAARNISKLIKPDYVIIGEASNLNLKIGQRGRGEIKVETFGVPAHSANPEKGVNAVYSMCKLVEEIRKLVPSSHPILGKGILELTDIKSSPYPGASVVPEYCAATYDRRLLVGETKESVIKPLEEVIEKAKEIDPNLRAKVSFAKGIEKCYTGNTIEGERFFPGWLFDKEEIFIKDIVEELNNMGFQPQITQYNFCTNGSHYAGEEGIRTIGMGPSKENLAHTIDEYIEIEQLTKVTECYYGIIKALLKEE